MADYNVYYYTPDFYPDRKVIKTFATTSDCILYGGLHALTFAAVNTAVLWVWQKLRTRWQGRPNESLKPTKHEPA
jgi:hypothetical protein